MFTPTTHEYVGTDRAYLPQGFMPFQTDRHGSEVILFQGDTVTVESAWERDYLPDAPTLLYVRSHTTGIATHVTASDLPLPA